MEKVRKILYNGTYKFELKVLKLWIAVFEWINRFCWEDKTENLAYSDQQHWYKTTVMS